LLVVTSDDYQKEGESSTFRLDDSCAHGSQPITIEITDGKVTHAEPESVWVQQGGG